MTAVNALQQETLASPEITVTNTGTTSSNTISWVAVPGATNYRIYGRTSGAELRISVVGQVTTFVDTGALVPAGALPVSNTTGPATPTVAMGALISCTVTATYASGNTCQLNRIQTMAVFAFPTYLNTGPRTTRTANNVTGNVNGYNMSGDANGIVTYVGQDFVNPTAPLFAGTQGGTNFGQSFAPCGSGTSANPLPFSMS